MSNTDAPDRPVDLPETTLARDLVQPRQSLLRSLAALIWSRSTSIGHRFMTWTRCSDFLLNYANSANYEDENCSEHHRIFPQCPDLPRLTKQPLDFAA